MNKITTQQSTWTEVMESASTMASTKERGNAKFLLRQGTCDGSARVIVDQSARQGTYDNGIGIGLLLQRWRQHWQEQ
jgi:hypothetical protein